MLENAPIVQGFAVLDAIFRRLSVNTKTLRPTFYPLAAPSTQPSEAKIL